MPRIKYGNAMGQEKEPSQPHGPKVGGIRPVIHSHSLIPKRGILKRGVRKRSF